MDNDLNMKKNIKANEEFLKRLNENLDEIELKEMTFKQKINYIERRERYYKTKLIENIFDKVGMPNDIDIEVMTGIAISLRENLFSDKQLNFFKLKAREYKK